MGNWSRNSIFARATVEIVLPILYYREDNSRKRSAGSSTYLSGIVLLEFSSSQNSSFVSLTFRSLFCSFKSFVQVIFVIIKLSLEVASKFVAVFTHFPITLKTKMCLQIWEHRDFLFRFRSVHYSFQNSISPEWAIRTPLFFFDSVQNSKFPEWATTFKLTKIGKI